MGSSEMPADSPFGPLLDALPDAVLVVNDDEDILDGNQAAVAMFGYDRHELAGRPIRTLVPTAPRLAADHRRGPDGAASRWSDREMSLTVSCRRRDGGEFPAEVAVSSLRTERGTLMVTSVRDATERSRAEHRLQAVLEISRAVLEGMDRKAVLGEVARRARELVVGELAVVAEFDAPAGGYRVATADGIGAEQLAGAQLRPGHSLMASVAGSQTAIATDDAGVHPEAHTAMAHLIDAGPTVVVPLPNRTPRPGSLAVVRPRGRPTFSPAELRLVELFAAQAAVALNYLDVRDELQRLAVVAERDRIGRELHDGAIQALFSVGISLQGTEMLTDDPVLQSRLELGVSQIDTVIRDLRNYVFGLRPGGLARRPLDQALYELADRFQRDHGVATSVEVDGGLAAELADMAPDLLQLAREAMSNVAKHAAARSCTITLRRQGDQALLEVADDGAGFALERSRGRGWGLRNIEERAATLGGRIQIRSAEGAGTTIRLLVTRR